ncbi:hypothetical protein PL8927_270241 [Planktothrix serta PCC 8927]|uniref:Uncharacterized protein n=1 Tax=Planktothrix serta PCC 8927 TaxID=671068 RepID=A0A7Z9DVT8_9CYAN|nr:DUF6395 domain-containing protein [Planktothrix serta]VXD14064.1 hypothetical protein PL8927_270241 [Planktothrix serta PCC 8927]
MNLKNLKITWTQEDNIVYLHLNNDKFYFEAPEGYQINEVDHEVKELAIFHLLWYMGYFEKIGAYEYPSHIHNKINKPLRGQNIGLAFSNGNDSCASLLCLPADQTIPIYCCRDFSKESSVKVIQQILNKSKAPFNICIEDCVNYNYNALRFMEKAKIKNLKIVKTDFELIRPYILNNENKNYSYGFHSGIGYSAIIILLSQFYNIGHIALGGIMESVFLGTGHRFIDVIDKKRKGESLFIRWHRIYKAYGYNFFYPLGGCSEVITTKIINQSPFKGTACSCNRKIENDKNYCENCFKCFRNLGMQGKLINYNLSWGSVLYKFPLKMATSSTYAAQKCGYTNEFLEQYKDIDLSYLEKYYTPYLEEENNIIDMVPNTFREYVKNKLQEYGIKPMNENDINKLIHCGDYFDNEKYNNLHIKTKDDLVKYLKK